MKKFAQQLATAAALFTIALFALTYFYAVTDLTEKMSVGLANAFYQLPWK